MTSQYGSPEYGFSLGSEFTKRTPEEAEALAEALGYAPAQIPDESRAAALQQYADGLPPIGLVGIVLAARLNKKRKDTSMPPVTEDRPTPEEAVGYAPAQIPDADRAAALQQYADQTAAEFLAAYEQPNNPQGA